MFCAYRETGRHLLRFVRLLMSRSHYQLREHSVRRPGVSDGSLSGTHVGFSHSVNGDLVRCLFTKINRVDGVLSYNLPSLELTLAILMHATARSVTQALLCQFRVHFLTCLKVFLLSVLSCELRLDFVLSVPPEAISLLFGVVSARDSVSVSRNYGGVEKKFCTLM